MTVRQIIQVVAAAGCLLVPDNRAVADPVKVSCSATFASTDGLGSFAHADLKDGVAERLYVEMGPGRAAMATTGPGLNGSYEATTPELMIWTYMSIYQPAKEWLAPGSVRLDYSGFRIRWPQFKSRGKPVTSINLNLTQGDQSMTVAVTTSAEMAEFNDRIFAIDFEEMLAGRYQAMRVDDHQGWRRAADAGRPISIVLTDASNGKVMARAEAPRLKSDMLQILLSGALNAARETYRQGKCA